MEKSEYFKSLTLFDLDILRDMEENNPGRIDIQPSVEPVIGRFLSFMVRVAGAKRVLELGTSVGCSTIWMANALKERDGVVYTIDNHELTPVEARKNFETAGVSSNVVQIVEDIRTGILKCGSEFDIIFQDGGKFLYPVMIDQLHDLLVPGGVLITDDTLFPCFESVRKNLQKHVDDFNQKILEDKRFYTVYLPIGHGLTLSYKR
ncbi:MAG: class I SAM-dependent methyltransferase [Spirochaetales bacterium]|nr:class I SAM-dependent methyltransferase [Spirochaetales bacterium]